MAKLTLIYQLFGKLFVLNKQILGDFSCFSKRQCPLYTSGDYHTPYILIKFIKKNYDGIEVGHLMYVVFKEYRWCISLTSKSANFNIILFNNCFHTGSNSNQGICHNLQISVNTSSSV